MQVPEYSVWEIEQRAEALLTEAYKTVYPYTVPVTVVDVEWVAEVVLGVGIRYVSGLRGRCRVDGVILPQSKAGPVILIDRGILDRQSVSRYRFTIAEEVGHYVLHCPHLPAVTTPDALLRLYRALENWHAAERNAKRFAAALLMPMKSLERQATGVYHGLAETPGIRSRDELVQRLVAILAKIFQVSQEAMRYRLAEYPARLMERIEAATKQGLKELPPRTKKG